MLCGVTPKDPQIALVSDWRYAGADDGLLAPSGKTALAIAIAAGAHEAVAILESANVPGGTFDDLALGVPPTSDEPIEPLGGQASEHPMYLTGINWSEAHMAPPGAPAEAEANEPENTPYFDLSRWESEEDRPPPEADALVAQAASAIQAAITEHEPIDSSADWEDIDAYLPERSLPLARTDDAEARERLRLLLLRAVRQGSVPGMWVEALSVNDDRSANPEAEALLSMVVIDLGAEVDERFEYASVAENFEVFVKPEEMPNPSQTLSLPSKATAMPTRWRPTGLTKKSSPMATRNSTFHVRLATMPQTSWMP